MLQRSGWCRSGAARGSELDCQPRTRRSKPLPFRLVRPGSGYPGSPRESTAAPQPDRLLAKDQTRFDSFDNIILSLYARSVAVWERPPGELYGVEVSTRPDQPSPDPVVVEVESGKAGR